MIFGISYYQLFELVAGALTIWVGVYLVSRNPFSTLSWITFLFLFALGYVIFFDPVLINAYSLENYIKWQKISDWTLFFMPVFFLHAALLTSNYYKKPYKYMLLTAYVLAVFWYSLDIHGGLILKENVIRLADYKSFSGFAAGKLLIPSVIFTMICLASGTFLFLKKIKENFYKYFLPSVSGLILTLSGVFVIISFYIIIPQSDKIFTYCASVAGFVFIYSLIKYHLLAPSEKYVFDKSFFYKTLLIVVFVVAYLLIIPVSGLEYSWNLLIFINFLIIIVFVSHSFYDWFGTFINDILFNISSGFSVVTDEEVSQIVRFYNSPNKIENSSLLRLNIIKNRTKDGKLPVDALREIIREVIEYFEPKENREKRNKANLKFDLLKMLAFDEAEEGQILWELGFEEYPVRIMSQENSGRPPLFKISSPSDYSYISRNAYLALKKEVMHDVAWRISYLEKLSKRR